MQSSVIGGAMLPHAPQFFTMPETEDRATVERVKAPQTFFGDRRSQVRGRPTLKRSAEASNRSAHGACQVNGFH